MIDNPREWFQSKVVELGDASKKKGALLDMKSVILNSEKNVLQNIARNTTMIPIIECLNSSDDQEIELCGVIMYELLSQISPMELLEGYGDFLHQSLSHNNDEVKKIGLKLFELTVTDNNIEYVLQKHDSLLDDVSECLTSSDRGTAEGAIKIFTKLGKSPSGLNALYSDTILQKLKKFMAVNDVVKFRVFEIIVEVSKVSSESLKAAISSGILKNLIDEVFSTNFLNQANALEIISTGLASSNHGLSYLLDNNLIQCLIDKIMVTSEEAQSEDSSMSFLIPSVIKFLASLWADHPEELNSKYPEVMTLLIKYLDTQDQMLFEYIVCAVCRIGSNSNGRLVLYQSKELMTVFCNKLKQFFTYSLNNSAVTVINSLCELFKNIYGGLGNEITEEWFNNMGPEVLERIIHMAKLPFDELRFTALTFMNAIASQLWGIKKLVTYPGGIEYLLDKLSESNKDCKKLKYEIVKKIVQSQDVEQTIDAEILKNLKKYLTDGPLTVSPEVGTVIDD